jgi:hypothetical protein
MLSRKKVVAGSVRLSTQKINSSNRFSPRRKIVFTLLDEEEDRRNDVMTKRRPHLF